MATSSFLTLVSVLIALVAAQDSDFSFATDGSCETDSGALLQTSKLQRAVNAKSLGSDNPADLKPGPSDQFPCWHGKMTVNQYKKCMASVPLDPAVRDCTVAMLLASLEDRYAYQGFFLDSLDNNAVLAPGYDFIEHGVELMADMQGLLSKVANETAAGTFVIDLATFVAKLKDGHSVLFSSIFSDILSIPPIIVRPELVSGRMEFRIEKADCELKGAVGKIVQTINGVSALEYFTEAAFAKGPGVKDASVAINQYLWNQNVRGLLPPQGGQINFVLTSGEQFNSSWVVDFDLQEFCSKEEVFQGLCRRNHTELLAAYLTDNGAFTQLAQDFIRNGMDLPCGLLPTYTIGDVVRSGFSVRSASSSPSPSWHFNSARSPIFENPQRAPIENRSDDSATDGSDDPARDVLSSPRMTVKSFSEAGCYAVRLEDKVDGKNICSLKLVGFVRVDTLRELQRCAVAAADFAEKHCDGDLLLDVLGNAFDYGEGIASGYWLNYFLYFNHPSKPFKRPLDVCEWSQYPKNPVMDQLVDIAQKGTPKLGDQTDPAKFIRGVSQRMRTIVESFSTSHLSMNVLRSWKKSADCLDELLASSGGETPQGEWVEFEAKYNECWSVGAFDLSPFGMNRSNMYPDPLTPNPLDWEFYNQTESQVRGGTRRNFTSLSFDIPSCPWHPANPMSTDFLEGGKLYVAPTKAITNVRTLSDGTCGSTCSVVVSQQYLEGLATVFTYGGISGQAMDISSRNGGDFSYFLSPSPPHPSGQPELKSFLDKSIWYPEVKPTYWPFMEFLPLANVGFDLTGRAHMAKALGPFALPREWYLLPAQYHLDYWTLKPLNGNPENYQQYDQNSLNELIYLYKEVNSKLPKPFQPRAPAKPEENSTQN